MDDKMKDELTVSALEMSKDMIDFLYEHLQARCPQLVPPPVEYIDKAIRMIKTGKPPWEGD